jgi:hypothetical protein
VDNTFRFEGVELKVKLVDDDERAAVLVAEMLRVGLAAEE